MDDATRVNSPIDVTFFAEIPTVASKLFVLANVCDGSSSTCDTRKMLPLAFAAATAAAAAAADVANGGGDDVAVGIVDLVVVTFFGIDGGSVHGPRDVLAMVRLRKKKKNKI